MKLCEDNAAYLACQYFQEKAMANHSCTVKLA